MSKQKERAELRRLVNEYLAAGGKVTQLPPMERKYVFNPSALRYADLLRKRAGRGLLREQDITSNGIIDDEHQKAGITLFVRGLLDELRGWLIWHGLLTVRSIKDASKIDAQHELDWWRYRALPKPYVPIRQLAHDPHSIRSNIPFDYEDRFLSNLEECIPMWGDTFEDVDHEFDEAERDSPSHDVFSLVAPDFTNELDRLFGQEVDEKKLLDDGLENARSRDAIHEYTEAERENLRKIMGTVRKEWKDFGHAWWETISKLRKEHTEERLMWRELIKCPS